MNLNSLMGCIPLLQTMVSIINTHIEVGVMPLELELMKIKNFNKFVLSTVLFLTEEISKIKSKPLTFNLCILNNILKLLTSSGVLLY